MVPSREGSTKNQLEEVEEMRPAWVVTESGNTASLSHGHLPVTFFICNGRCCISFWRMLAWKRNIRPVCLSGCQAAH